MSHGRRRSGKWRGEALQRRIKAQKNEQAQFDAKTEKLLRLARKLALKETWRNI
jgi:hypothetical protein